MPSVSSVSEVSGGGTPRALGGQAGPRRAHRQGAVTNRVRAGGWGSKPPAEASPALSRSAAARHGPVQVVLKVQSACLVITAVIVFPSLACDFVGLPAAPEASSGPALGKHGSASGWFFFSVVVSTVGTN